MSLEHLARDAEEMHESCSRRMIRADSRAARYQMGWALSGLENLHRPLLPLFLARAITGTYRAPEPAVCPCGSTRGVSGRVLRVVTRTHTQR